jgi:Mor family transcriptional regulator
VEVIVQEIIDVIGYQAMLKLSETFAGCSIYIPSGKSLKLAERNRLIKSERLAGAEIKTLAMKYQLTTRQVFSILK